MANPRILNLFTIAAAVAALGACSPASDAPIKAQPAAPALATPAVTMAANPPPPFTYWAPEGSTIRNHDTDPGTWIAEGAGGSRKFYFGDQCRASERQGWVGETIDILPPAPVGQTWRLVCLTCVVTSDLQRRRLNISYDATTRRVVEVSCG